MNAFRFAFAQKPNSVVIIGTDSPTFPAEFITQAFEFLETDADAVPGKTADGGFYLIGLKTLHEKMWDGVLHEARLKRLRKLPKTSLI